MISVRPITARVSRHLLRMSLEDAAERTIEVDPESCWPVDPPITLPGEANRVVGHHSDSVAAFNFERLQSPIMRQAPTRLHLLRDVIIGGGMLLARNTFDRVAPGTRKFVVRGEPDFMEEAALCSNYLTQRYFGHWLREGVTLELTASDRGLPVLVLDRHPWFHEAGYRDLLSLHPRRTRLARIDKLWVFDFFRFNGGFVQRYNRLRHAIRTEVQAPDQGSDRIYLARGATGAGRSLANQDELCEGLSRQGFIILEPELMEVRDIARALARARLVVAPEGSALAHATIAIPRGAGLLTIIGAQHFNMNYKVICNALDFKFGFAIGDAIDEDRFHQPLDRLMRTVDLVEGAVHRGPHGQTTIGAC